MLRLIKSFKNAFSGILDALRSEPNFQIHFCIGISVIVLGFFFSLHTWEWVAIIMCISIVTGFELINTSFEKMMYLLHPETHNTVKRIKDLSAGAVLITAICAGLIGIIIFLPKVLVLF